MMAEAVAGTAVPAPLENSDDPFHVLVSTLISLRTRDSTTRKVSARVLKAAPDVPSMLSIEHSRLEELLRPAGFFRQKASQLRRISDVLHREHGDSVPRSLEELLALPGVGRKTANFVLGMVFGIPAICVDVHVHRIANRMGLVRTPSPEATEYALQAIFPADEWIGINHSMVRFGQTVCRPASPRCGICPFSDDCPSASDNVD